ncbi:hypothetical protein KKG31_08540 [Patescibacteria group bacterium]|nr:hypothetical protein [Patescibacteria group bacterium]MBU1759102.1 hypothetical protein [Patescibacteria group bacterium]
MEIKTGVSSLNRNERMIKNCIDAQRIEYRIWKK